jgi:hypothetical protein
MGFLCISRSSTTVAAPEAAMSARYAMGPMALAPIRKHTPDQLQKKMAPTPNSVADLDEALRFCTARSLKPGILADLTLVWAAARRQGT